MDGITLFNADALETIKTFSDKSIDLIVTDPPYDIAVDENCGGMLERKGLGKSFKQLKDSDIVSGYDIKSYGKEFFRILKTVNLYIWCNKKQIPEYLDFYVLQNECLFEILTWHKTNALPNLANKYITDTEFLLYFHKKGGFCQPNSYEDGKSYFMSLINLKDKKVWHHPTIKPLEFTKRVIRNSSREGETVLDCFMGSGTTGVACKELNRNFIGIERNPEFFKSASIRLGEESLW